MRHNVKGRKLGRTSSHRKATMQALTTSLLKHKRIKTTLAKAKELRTFAEKLITKAKKGDLHSQRQVMDYLKDKDVVKELFSEIVERIGDRPGGYTRVVKLGQRFGDAAHMALVELVDYNEIATAKEEKQKEERDAKAKEKEEKEKAEQVEEAPVAEIPPETEKK
ncbi:MAG: 50S ribosomal protein L17 [Ignavibacteria bacterium]|nr:50S ribosomal protein L17 [Ignavibacteria bacterium]MBT8383836.1 50S ribosomal protein L17 [Ignavibacteria bacterium]MBT8392082.1 50S ribosomal protein L17 [Ignavibacteria bacterium]NNJ54031.1 50S ribosomal protein L17 [Ignavibacteriaceae bacterium]NNL21009.1 50S ribosomal protein L17 [Ignavibacteriaceae bacterium]